MMVVPWGAGAWGGPPEAAIAAAGWQARFWAVVRLLLAAGLGCGAAVGVVGVGSPPTALSIFRIDQRTANSARLAEFAAMDKFHVLAMAPTTTNNVISHPPHHHQQQQQPPPPPQQQPPPPQQRHTQPTRRQRFHLLSDGCPPTEDPRHHRQAQATASDGRDALLCPRRDRGVLLEAAEQGGRGGGRPLLEPRDLGSVQHLGQHPPHGDGPAPSRLGELGSEPELTAALQRAAHDSLENPIIIYIYIII